MMGSPKFVITLPAIMVGCVLSTMFLSTDYGRKVFIDYNFGEKGEKHQKGNLSLGIRSDMKKDFDEMDALRKINVHDQSKGK